MVREDDMEMAKRILNENELSLVIVNKSNIIFKSQESGIRSLIQAIETSGETLLRASVADKIVGKAAALLMLYAGMDNVHANLVSEPAEQLLSGRKKNLSYLKMVTNILNRDRSDICPMEKMSLKMQSPEEAFMAFSELLKRTKLSR